MFSDKRFIVYVYACKLSFISNKLSMSNVYAHLRKEKPPKLMCLTLDCRLDRLVPIIALLTIVDDIMYDMMFFPGSGCMDWHVCLFRIFISAWICLCQLCSKVKKWWTKSWSLIDWYKNEKYFMILELIHKDRRERRLKRQEMWNFVS